MRDVPKLGWLLPILGMLPILLGANPVNAQVYRCTEGGKTVYQDGPCAAGEQRGVNTQGNSGMVGDRYAPDKVRSQERTAQPPPTEPAAKAPRTVLICTGTGGTRVCSERTVKAKN